MIRRPVRLVAAIALAALTFTPLAANAQFPGTNGRLFYQNGTNLHSVNPDGTNDTLVPGLIADGPGNTVAVSKDGTKVVFTVSAGLEMAGSDGSNATALTSTAGDVDASWSADGNTVYFADAAGDIVSVASNGTGRTTLFTAAGTVTYAHPVLSPDGTTLFFMQTDSSSNVTDADSGPAAGGSATNLTNFTNTDFLSYIDVSPDGTKLLLTEFNTTTGANVETIPVGGGSPTVLRTLQAVNPGDLSQSEASWSPDGTKIAIVEHPSGSGGSAPGAYEPGALWEMNANGSGAAQVLSATTQGPVYWSVVTPTAVIGLPNTGGLKAHWPVALGLLALVAVGSVEAARRVRLSR